MVAVSQKPIRQTPSAKNDTGEFGNFTRLLDRLLKVPHAKVKAELAAEKQSPASKRKRADVGHAYRDTD
jgi:hypothetical protein